MIAFANVESPKTFPYLDNGWFVVIMVEYLSYLAAINLKKIDAYSLSIGRYPIPSMINILCFE